MCERALRYIDEISTGRKEACWEVRAAVQRHLNDLKRSKRKDFEYYFDPEEAERVIEFFELQRFSENQLAGQPFILLPWQAFVLWSVYGWRRKKDHLRRFVRVVVKVPRGNGKTEFAAGIGNVGLMCEQENDPQVFWLASKKAQAAIGWGRQKIMVERMRSEFPEVAAMVKTAAHSIYEVNGAGFVKYMGRDSRAEDGFSPYYAIGDEVHGWKNNDLLHVLESGFVKRRRPLTCLITTEGYERDGPWDELESNCKSMLNGTVPQDELFALLFNLPENADWQDPKMWALVNPSLGVSVDLETFATRYRQACAEGLATETDFKVKNLNIKVRSGRGWIKDEHWLACPSAIDLPALRGRKCFGGVDLSSTFDFSSLCLAFPEADDPEAYTMLWWNWLPEEAFEKRARKFPIFYEWQKAGYITVVPGNYIEYEYIRHVINEACKDYDVQVIGCDPANAWQLIGNLQGDGVPIEKYGMGWANISEPAKQLERSIAGGKINHGNNPVARWMVQNTIIKTDSNNNYRPDKGRSTESIDGVLAAIIAIGQHLTQPAPTLGPMILTF